MTTMKEMTYKKVFIEKRTKPDFASAMAEITAVADAGFIAELTALEPENVAGYHFGINYQKAWEIGIYRWEEEGFKVFADGEEIDRDFEEVDSMDADFYAATAFADKPQHYINKDVMDALRASAPKFEENEMSIVTTADYFGKPVGIESPEVPEPAQDTDGPDEVTKSEGMVSRLTKKFWGKPKGEDNAQNAYAEALANLNAEEKKFDINTSDPKFPEFESEDIEVYVLCESCGAENFQMCYKTNSYIKCMNCKDKMHIRTANEYEKKDLNVEYMANRKYRTVKERYEFKQSKGLI